MAQSVLAVVVGFVVSFVVPGVLGLLVASVLPYTTAIRVIVSVRPGVWSFLAAMGAGLVCAKLAPKRPLGHASALALLLGAVHLGVEADQPWMKGANAALVMMGTLVGVFVARICFGASEAPSPLERLRRNPGRIGSSATTVEPRARPRAVSAVAVFFGLVAIGALGRVGEDGASLSYRFVWLALLLLFVTLTVGLWQMRRLAFYAGAFVLGGVGLIGAIQAWLTTGLGLRLAGPTMFTLVAAYLLVRVRSQRFRTAPREPPPQTRTRV